MAPYNAAVCVRASNCPPPSCRVAYEGNFDPTWNIASIPCGGYALSVILQACIQHQSTTKHIDPLHISAHFLRPTNAKIPFTVYVNRVKVGKGFSNLVAELFQEDLLRITTHSIFGVNGPTPEDPLNLLLRPPSSYARRHPISIHPSQGTVVGICPIWNFQNHVSWSYDSTIMARNEPSHPSRVSPPEVGGAGLEWGGYLQFNTPTERLTNAYIPFIVDMFVNTINLLPPSELGLKKGGNWFPTMTLAVDFKFPISMLSPEKHSMRTVGLYSTGRYITHPQGRHDAYVEVWSAPSNIGEGSVREGWRENQFCLAIATQMALTVPLELNIRNGRKPLAKL